MLETWKICHLSDNYLISDTGVIKHKEGWYPKVHTRPDGYISVSIDRESQLVHRLVGFVFLTYTPDKPQINHKNGIKSDNRAENLEWCDGYYNQYHRFNVLNKRKTNTTNHRSGLEHGNTRPLKLINGVETLYFKTAKEAAAHFNVKYGTSISNAIARNGIYRGYTIERISKSDYPKT